MMNFIVRLGNDAIMLSYIIFCAVSFRRIACIEERASNVAIPLSQALPVFVITPQAEQFLNCHSRSY